jgi:hypothetical protein
VSPETINEVLSELSQAQNEAARRFEQLARAIAAGEPRDAADVLQVLQAAGKTRDDVATLTRLFERRAVLRDKLAESERLEQRNAELLAEIEAAGAKLQQAQREHAAAVQPLQFELLGNRQKQVATFLHQQELFNGCQSAELRARLRWIQHAQQQNEAARRDADASLLQSENALRSRESRNSPQELERATERRERAGAALAECQSKAAELVAEADEVCRLMREW